MLWSISQTRNNMFQARCAKKVHSDDVLHEKNYMLRALCREKTTYSDMLPGGMSSRETFFRGQGILWTFSQPGDSMVTTRYGRNSML